MGMFSACAGMSAGLVSCEGETVSPELEEKVLISEISIGVTPELPLLIGTDSLMTWQILPDNASNKNVIWTSASPEIASVSPDGLITANALGTAVITVAPEWGYATNASVTVTVIDEIVFVDGIKLTNPTEELSIYETASVQLQWTISPAEATYKSLKWESLTTDIVSVSETGVVRGIKKGTGRIRATATDERHYSAEFEITVMEMIPVESLELDGTRTEFAIGEVSKLGVKVTPDNATLSTLAWESSDHDVLTVGEDGVVTVHDYGTATITASADYGDTKVSDELTVRVVEGLVNDEFDYVANWEIFNGIGAVVNIENGELVLTPGDDKNYKALRLMRTGGINFHIGNYPVLAVKIRMPKEVVESSVNMEHYLDVWTKGQTPAGKFGENTDKGKNQMEVKDCGEYMVYIADFTKKGLGTSNDFMPTGNAIHMANVEFQWWKLWYESGAELDGTIRIDWVKTFESMDELNALINSESNN